MTTRQQILDWHDDLLDIMLEHRVKNPEFTFAPRQKNNSGRLEQGFWFQGSNYIFISPYKRGDSKNKTRTIGFVVHPDSDETWCSLEIASPAETDTRFQNCYLGIVRTFKAKASVRTGVYRMRYPAGEVKQLFKQFIEMDKPRIDSIIQRHGLYDSFYITPSEFDDLKANTERYRKEYFEKKGLLVEDSELGEYEEGEERDGLREHKRRERNRKFVADYKRKHQGVTHCPGCSIDIGHLYGLRTIQLLELHHIVPFSKIKEKRKMREEDAILLCPNCHRAIHKYMVRDKLDNITLEEFKIKITSKSL